MSPVRLLLLVAATVFLVTILQIGLLQVAFSRLGLSAESAILLLMLTLFGSMINLPLFTVSTDPAEQAKRLHDIPRLLLKRIRVIPGRTIIAVNVGGCVVPLAFSLYLFNHSQPDVFNVLAYIGGTLGVLIGADLLRMKDIGKLGEPLASIGGAGSFDGIFVTGIVAVLLT